MTLGEIKQEYVNHNCIYFDTVQRLMKHCNMPLGLAEKVADSWQNEWFLHAYQQPGISE